MSTSSAAKKFYEYHINLKVDYSNGFCVGLEPKDGWRETKFCFNVKCMCEGGKSSTGEPCTGHHHARIKVVSRNSLFGTSGDPPRRCLPLTGSELAVMVLQFEFGGELFHFEPSVDLRRMCNDWISVMKHSNFQHGKLVKTFELTNGRFLAPPPTWEDPDYGFQFDPMPDWKNKDRPEIVVSGTVKESDDHVYVLKGWDAQPRSVRDWPKLFEEAESENTDFVEYRSADISRVDSMDLISTMVKTVHFNQCSGLDSGKLECLTGCVQGLEELKLVQCSLGGTVNISSNSLKTLSVELCPGLRSIFFDLPSLETFVLMSREKVWVMPEDHGDGEIETVFCMGCEEALPHWKRFANIRLKKLEDYDPAEVEDRSKIASWFKRGSTLEVEDRLKIASWFKRGSTLDFYILNEETALDWFDTFLSFGLSSLSRGLETLTLLVFSTKNFVFPFKLEGALCDVKTLIIEVIETVKDIELINIFNSALRRCPHLSTLHIVSGGDPNKRKSFQFEYEPGGRENHQTCRVEGGEKNLRKVTCGNVTKNEESCLIMQLCFDNEAMVLESAEIEEVVHRRDEFFWEQVKWYAKREELGD